MDFFEAQDRAHARTKLLVLYFALAVILIIAAIYFAVTAGVYFYHHKANSGIAPELFSSSRLIWTTGLVVPLIVCGSLWRITQLRSNGGAGVAKAMGGRKVDPSSRRPHERKLMNIVEEMSIASGTPMPEVYLLDREEGINAFAAGFGLNDAVVGVTQGAIEQLDRDELQGVIAHEFSHILNGDMTLSTKLSGWIFGIVMLTVLGRGFKALISGGSDSGRRSGGGIYIGGSGGRSRGSSSDSKGNGGALILAIILVAVLITIIGFIGEFFARLIQAAVSRQREYLADASAVQFTRNPEGIGNALRRIGGGCGSRVSHPQASEFAHAFFSKSLKSEVSFWATHPPLPKRIQRIMKDWQGDYLKPRPRPETKEEKKEKPKPRKHAFGPAIGPDGAGGGGQFQQMLTAGLFMKCLGQLQEQGRAYAEKTRETLHTAVPELFEDADQSSLAILALLYQKDESVAQAQRQLMDGYMPGIADEVAPLVDQLRSLSRSERLILLEMMAGRLPEAVPPAEREDFIHCIIELVRADLKVDPFEMACLNVVRRRLFKESDFAPKDQSMETIILAARTLGTRLAMETHLDNTPVATVLQSASRQAPYFMNQLEPAESTDFEALEEAFHVLARTSFGLRKQFLQICERIVAADQKATQDEVELLRAIAMGIGVPSAPIFPESEANAG